MTRERSGPLPRITIVTPSFQQGRFLEEAIRSVLRQGYPNLEYIVMDGGSRDDSLEIIRKYQEDLTYWRSEPDDGQSAAILDGFTRGTGSILGWVNADDVLLPGALWTAAKFLAKNPQTDLLVGAGVYIDVHSKVTARSWGSPPSSRSLLYWCCGGFVQPASFWRRDAFERAGGFTRSLRVSMDYDLYLRLTRAKAARSTPAFLGGLRIHEATKTSKLREEVAAVDRELTSWYGKRSYPPGLLLLIKIAYRSRYVIYRAAREVLGLLRLRWVPPVGATIEELFSRSPGSRSRVVKSRSE
jgi:glycosyltransferase involved in cell wall biosynthesis